MAYLRNERDENYGSSNKTGNGTKSCSKKRCSTNIAVTAMACKLPRNLNDPSDFWEAMKVGRDGSAKIPCSRIGTRDNLMQARNGSSLMRSNFLNSDISLFDASFFGISRSEGEKMDPQQRILLQCVYECMENANMTSLADTGIYVGVMSIEYANLFSKLDMISMLGSSASVLSGRVNFVFDSSAPSVTIDTACSSSLVAFDLAVKAILNNECPRAIVAGINLILTEDGLKRRMNGAMLSDDGICKAFDARANGYGRADGCTVLLLEKISTATNIPRPIYGYVSTVHCNHVGRGVSLVTPSKLMQKKMIERCMRNIDHQECPTYWETHGTGTVIGDEAEIYAICSTLDACVIGTAKTFVGHSEAGSGATGLIKLLMQMRNGYVPQHMHYAISKSGLSDQIRLPLAGEDWIGCSMGISSFGVSGTNAAALITTPKMAQVASSTFHSQLYSICPISAKSDFSLQSLIHSYTVMLRNSHHTSTSICTAAALYRRHMQFRAALIIDARKQTVKSVLQNDKFQATKPFGLKIDLNEINMNHVVSWARNNNYWRMLWHSVRTVHQNVMKIKNSLRKRTKSMKLHVLCAHFYALLLYLNDVGNVIVTAFRASDAESLKLLRILLVLLDQDPSFSHNNSERRKIFVCEKLFDDMRNSSKNSLNHLNVKRLKHKDGNYEWLDSKLLSAMDLEELTAKLYISGIDIDWHKIYTSSNSVSILLPNYVFKYEKLWYTKRESPIDDSLVGTVNTMTDEMISFINFLNVHDNSICFDFLIDNEQKLPFGVAIEIVITAIKLVIAMRNLKGFRSVNLESIVFHYRNVQNGSMIRTELLTNSSTSYEVSISIDEAMLLSAQIQLNHDQADRIECFHHHFVPVSNFYEILQRNGITCKRNLQMIAIQSTIRELFKIACLPINSLAVSIEAVLQILIVKAFISKQKFDVSYLHGLNQIRLDERASSTLIIDLSFHYIRVLTDDKEFFAVSNASLQTKSNSSKAFIETIRNRSAPTTLKIKDSRCVNGDSRTERKPALNDIIVGIKCAMEDVIGNSENQPESISTLNFNEIGLDSLALGDFATRLSENYFIGVNIRVVDIFDHPTLQSLAEYIHSIIVNDRYSHSRDEDSMNAEWQHVSKNEGTDKSESYGDNLKEISTNTSKNDSGLSLSRDRSCESITSIRYVCNTHGFFQKFNASETSTMTNYFRVTLTDKADVYSQSIVIVPKQHQPRYDKNLNSWIIYQQFLDQISEAFEKLTFEKRRIMLQFDFTTVFSMRLLIKIALVSANLAVISKKEFVILAQPNLGRANAFIIGFMKSLAAEYYPRIQFHWNFTIKNLNMSMLANQNERSGHSEKWLITGGTRGIGWETAKWIAKNRNVSSITILGRNSLPKIQQKAFDELRKTVNIEVLSIDIASRSKVKYLFQHRKFTSIIHSAGILNDAFFKQLTEDKIYDVCRAKCNGLKLLIEMSDRYAHDLKHFILNSSISAVFGNSGQCNYAAANAYANELMRERRIRGFASTVINWGNWREVGMAVGVNEQLEVIGLIGMKTLDALEYLRLAIEHSPESIIVANIDMEKFLKFRPNLRQLFEMQNEREIVVDNERIKSTKQMAIIENNEVNLIINNRTHAKEPLQSPKQFCRKFLALALSAHSPYELECKIDSVCERISQSPHDFDSISSGCYNHVVSEKFVATFSGRNRHDLVGNMRASRSECIIKRGDTPPEICFVFPGQGSQIWNMGRQLMESFPIFRETMLKTLSMAQAYLSSDKFDLMHILYDWTNRSMLYETEYSQPIIFCFCYSLAKLYSHFNVKAAYCLGHSVSEIVALTVSGMIEIEDAIKIIVQRGKILAQLRRKGKMIVVDREYGQMLARLYNVEIAAVNSPKQIIIAGSNESIDLCLNRANADRRNLQILDHQYPFHTSLIEEVDLKQFCDLCKRIQYNKWKDSKVFSSVTGKLMKKLNRKYLIKQLSAHVLFAKSVAGIENLQVRLWLEVGMGEALTNCILDTVDRKSATVITSLKNRIGEAESFMKSLVELERAGISINWTRGYPLQLELVHCSIRYESLQERNLPTDFRACVNTFVSICDEYGAFEVQHQIYDKPVIPAALVLCCLSIIGTDHHERVCRIRAAFKAILLRKPIKCLNNLSLVLGQTEGALEIRSGETLVYELIPATISILPNTSRPGALVSLTCIESSAFYESLRAIKLQYGPLFMVLCDIQRAEGKISAKLTNIEFPFLLIEGAFQALLAAAYDFSNPIVYIPFRINILELACSTITHGKEYSAYGEITEQNSEFLLGNITIFEENEAVCIAQGISARAIAKTLTDNSDNIDQSMLHTNAHELIRTMKVSPSSLSLSHLTEEPVKAVNETNSSEYECSREIVGIIGYSGRFTNSLQDCSAFWNNAKASVCLADTKLTENSSQCATEKLFDFDPEFFDLSPKEVLYMDPQQRFILEAVQQAMENAAIQDLDHNTGVFIGISSCDFAQRAYAELDELSPYLATGTNNSTIAGRIAHWLNISGPTIALDTACSSFMTALICAVDNIAQGRCNMALVGAVNIMLSQKTTDVLSSAGVLSKRGYCAVFDSSADGYCRANGVIMILIRKLKNFDSFKGVTIKSRRICHNGNCGGITVPNRKQQLCIMSSIFEAWEDTCVDQIEAHATGTKLGDNIELASICEMISRYQRDDFYLTSVKSSLGHCEAAAGGASLLSVLLSVRHNYLTALPHFCVLPSGVVNAENFMLPIIGTEVTANRTVMINCFGLSGTSTCLLLHGDNTERRSMRSSTMTKYHIVVASGKSLLQLQNMLQELISYMENSHDLLTDICTALQQSRKHYRYRAASIVSSLQSKIISSISFGEFGRKKPSILYDFTQYSLQYSELYEMLTNFPCFKAIFFDIVNNDSKQNVRSGVNDKRLRYDLDIQSIAKKAVLKWLCEIGLVPSFVIAANQFDRELVQTILLDRQVSNERSKSDPTNGKEIFVDEWPHEVDSFIINSNNLALTSSSKTVQQNMNGFSLVHRYAFTIAQFYIYGFDINWRMISPASNRIVDLPYISFNRRKLCPFPDYSNSNDLQQLQKNLLARSENKFSRNPQVISKKIDETMPQNERIPSQLIPSNFSDEISSVYSVNASRSFRKTYKEVDELIQSSEELQSPRYDTDCRNWLYKEEYLRCNLNASYPNARFIAINFCETDKTVLDASIGSLIISNENEVHKVREYISDYQCSQLVVRWKDEYESLEDGITIQSLIIIRLWMVLDELCINNGLKCPAITVCLVKSENVTGCTALLRTLASERPNVLYKFIEIDKTNHILLKEISAPCWNETVKYNQNVRYVQRLKLLDDFEKLFAINVPMNRILVTGGLGGIGKALIRHFRPKSVVIVTRNGKRDDEVEELLRVTTAKVRIVTADCGKLKDMERIFSNSTPIDFIFHCAGTVENAMMENMDRETFLSVMIPKVRGTMNLMKLCEIHSNTKLIAFSSIAAIFGSAGQANYAVANQVMEQLVLLHDNGLVLSWGPWENLGMLDGAEKMHLRKHIMQSGWNFLQPYDALNAASKLISSIGRIFVVDINFSLIIEKTPHLLNLLGRKRCIKAEALASDNRQKNKSATMRTEQSIRRIINEVSGIQKVDENSGFMSIGIDSLMITEIRRQISVELGLKLSSTFLYDHCTLRSLIDGISQILLHESDHGNNVQRISTSTTEDEVVVIGYSGGFSGAEDVDEFWKNLTEGVESIKRDGNNEFVTDGDYVSAGGILPGLEKFDPKFWRISVEDATFLDPQVRKFLEHVYWALEKSGEIKTRTKTRIAVLAGSEPSEYNQFVYEPYDLMKTMYARNQKDFLANWTSYLLNLNGPTFAIYSACSTGLLAITQAMNLLKNNECEVAIVGSCSLVLPHQMRYQCKIGGIFSSRGQCRPFDHYSDGTVRGSAVGAIILTTKKRAESRGVPIHAIIESFSVNNDGSHKSSFMSPNVSGQKSCIRHAVASLRTMKVDNVIYVECHGTATAIGDSIELNAMSGTYRNNLLIGSVKANIGHGFAGSGIAGFLKLCKIIENRIIPKQINFERMKDELLSMSYSVPTENIRIGAQENFGLGISSFGVGGTNVHMIIRPSLQHCRPQKSCKKFYVLPISAKSEASCVMLCQKIADYMSKTAVNLSSVAYTLQNYREELPYRNAFVVTDTTDAIAQLRSANKFTSCSPVTKENIIFYFSPQGVQYVGMAASSLEDAPIFLKCMRNCGRISFDKFGVNIFEEIYTRISSDKDGYITEQPHVQLANFAINYSIYQQLHAWGIECSMAIGHSLGEYSAAACGDSFDLKTAIEILIERGRLMSRTKNRKMIAIRNYDGALPKGIEINVVLSKKIKCVTGDVNDIENFTTYLNSIQVDCRDMRTAIGFHSSSMEPIITQFSQYLGKFHFKPPKMSIISNVDGEVIKKFDKNYMINHMRSPVRIDKCLDNLPSTAKIVVEIGPSGILNYLMTEEEKDITIVPTVLSNKRKGESTRHILNAVADLWRLGTNIDWYKLLPRGDLDTNLPTYQFEKETCWTTDNIVSNHKARLYKRCWVDLNSTTHESLSFNRILIFIPCFYNQSLQELILALKNRFCQYHCIVPDGNVEDFDSSNEFLRINPSVEAAYQCLAAFLTKSCFKYQYILHLWNFKDELFENDKQSVLNFGFYSMLWIKKHLIDDTANDRVRIVFALSEQPPADLTISLAPLRELHAVDPLTDGFLIQLPADSNLSYVLDRISSMSANPPFCRVRYMNCGALEEIGYKEETPTFDNPPVNDKDVVIVFGGTGLIGRSSAIALMKNFISLTVILVSRQAADTFNDDSNTFEELKYWSCKRNHCLEGFNLDIGDFVEMKSMLKRIYAKYGKINTVIHAAGSPTVSVVNKTTTQMETVFRTKVVGTMNILQGIAELNIHIDLLVLSSSLSAIIGLHGNVDYSGSNIFLDTLASRTLSNVTNAVSIQWPAWKNGGMLEKYNKLPQNLRNLLISASITRNEGEEAFLKCICQRGVVAVTSVDPLLMLNEIKNAQIPKISGEAYVKQPEECCLNDTVQKIWQKALSVMASIQSTDNFFELGGNSLNGMQITWEINRCLNIKCTVQDLFDHSNFVDFIRFLICMSKMTVSDVHNETTAFIASFQPKRPSLLPVTFSQENMFLLRSIFEPTLYNIHFLISFRGGLDASAMKKAILNVTARQTSFRSVFLERFGSISQTVLSLTESYHHLNWVAGNNEYVGKMIESEKSIRFSLETVPYRIVPLKVADDTYKLIISFHHIVIDGWSISIFANELLQYYQYYTRDSTKVDRQNVCSIKKLGCLGTTISDYAIWQRSDNVTSRISKDVKVLSEKLRVTKPTRILVDREMPKRDMIRMKQYTLNLPKILQKQIESFANDKRTTKYVVMLTAFICTVRRFSAHFDSDEVVIGCPVSGRNSDQTKSIIGYFLNNVVIVIDDVKVNSGINDLVGKVIDVMHDARKFEHVPFHQVVAEMKLGRQYSEHPLFDIFFNYRHDLDFPTIKLSHVKTDIRQLSTNTNFDLSFTMDDTVDFCKITIDYNSSLYHMETIENFSNVYQRVINEIELGQMKSTSIVEVPTEVHWQRWNECKPYSLEGLKTISKPEYADTIRRSSMIEIVLRQLEICGEMFAVRTDQNATKYNTLIEDSVMTARYLEQMYIRRFGVSLRVDLCSLLNIDDSNPRQMLTSIIAVLSAGAAYVPQDRLQPQIKKLQIEYLLDKNFIEIYLQDIIVSKLSYEQYKCEPMRSRAKSLDLVYVLFTSGSTGVPKGVCVAHSNLVNFIVSSTKQTFLRPQTNVYNATRYIFDVSCVNIFGTLCNGSTLVVAENVLDTSREIARNDISFAFLPSALFNTMNDIDFERISTVDSLAVGGESPSRASLIKCLANGIQTRQIYGPTETTVWSVTNRCKLYSKQLERNIGTPMQNEGLIFVDNHASLASHGIAELIIIGECVARGYLGKESGMKHDVFQLNPYRSKEDVILGRNYLSYRTGDLVRLLGNNVAFIARKDSQLKIRGYRIEPSEIEDAIRSCDPRIAGIYICKCESTNSLIAFVERCEVGINLLKNKIRRTLPAHANPQILIALEKFPLNNSGKVDKNALTKMIGKHLVATGSKSIELEFNVTEEKLARIWENILKSGKPMKTDNFFLLGGHSLSVLLMRNKIKETFLVELKFEEIFCSQNLSDVARMIEERLSVKVSKSDECISVVRERNEANYNVYLIHAIGGTIFHYYNMLTAIPNCFNVYGIEYDASYEASTLMDLAQLYADQILKHCKGTPYIVGHSLGGILAREIAYIIRTSRRSPPFIIMVDSWCSDIKHLHEGRVKAYLMPKLMQMPNKESIIANALKLTRMLKCHTFTKTNVEIILLKASDTSNSVVKRANISEDTIQLAPSNGWQMYSTSKVRVYLCDGDHDSLMHQTHVNTLRKILHEIFSFLLS